MPIRAAIPGISQLFGDARYVPRNGVADLADGSAAAPSVTFASDLDTGIFRPAANAWGVATGGVSRLEIDSVGRSLFSGNVGIGVTPDVRMHISAANATAQYRLGRTDIPRTWTTYIDGAGAFSINDVTRGSDTVKITTDGYFKASNDGTYFGVAGTYHEMRNTGSNAIVAFSNTNAVPYGNYHYFSTAANNTTSYFQQFVDSAALRAMLYSNGDWQNANGVYGMISDRSTKQEIEPARSQWDDVKRFQLKRWRNKADVATLGAAAPYRLGFVADEVEAVSPGVVQKGRAAPATLYGPKPAPALDGVALSIVSIKMFGALQEAMQRIEALEAWKLSLPA